MLPHEVFGKIIPFHKFFEFYPSKLKGQIKNSNKIEKGNSNFIGLKID